MKLDKKQLPQLIVLGVLMLLFIGYLSFQAMSPSSSTAPAASKSEAEQTSNSETADAANAGEARADVSETDSSLDPGLAVVRRDPFTPQRMPGAKMGTTNDTQPQSVRVTPTIVKNPMGRVPPLSLGPANPFSQMLGAIATAGQPTSLPQVEQVPAFTITGVIRGDNNVAIIRSGDNARYVVKQGQLIDGRYRVISVTNDGAVLAYKNRRIHLKLGGAKNAS